MKESARKKDTIPAAKSIALKTIQGNFTRQTKIHFDSSSLVSFIKQYPLLQPYESDLRKFYQGRNFAYAWYDKNGLIEQAYNLHNHLANLEDEGVQTRMQYEDSLNAIIGQADDKPDLQIELMLSAQYFQYAERVWGGLNEKDTKALNWFIPRKQLDLPVLLDSLLKDSSFIGQGYSFRQYNLLKEYLRKYRNLTSRPYQKLVNDHKPIKPGDSAGIIIGIRERLFDYGDLKKNSGSSYYDKGLEKAVIHYQYRMGMTPDGILGNSFLNSLNTPVEDYVTKIILNMERSRWVPVSLTNNYLIVNIPAFELFAFENDSLVLTMKVVVGKAVHKTVIFDGELKYIVFSPYWNVPPDIMKKEILPGIKKDPRYLEKHDMEWNGNQVRQRPGPKNSLGLVKFLFPNSYNIYLHDSPQKNLFKEDVRAFSHGCIRLAEPKKLASYLLRNMPSWTPDKIDVAMKKGREQYVTLKDPVPVYIGYLTAWVDREGAINFRKDIYNRDSRLAEMIIKNKN
jgi:murein L,D-transpeptidase YcbB/YkuD